LVVNETEAAFLCGQRVETDEEITLAPLKLRELGASLVIITLGKRGAFALSANEKVSVPAFKVKAMDTTSAGDVFCGSFAVAQIEGRSLTESLRFASAASAICVTRMGAQPSAPRRKEIDEFLIFNK
jgi:ribokinase